MLHLKLMNLSLQNQSRHKSWNLPHSTKVDTKVGTYHTVLKSKRNVEEFENKFEDRLFIFGNPSY